MLLRNRLSPQPFGSNIVWKIIMKRGKSGERNLDLNFVGLVTMRKISAFDNCEWWSATGLRAALQLNYRCHTHFSCESPNVTNHNLNSSLIHGEKGGFGHVIFPSRTVQDSNNQPFTADWAGIAPPPNLYPLFSSTFYNIDTVAVKPSDAYSQTYCCGYL